ncbi:Acetyltransferase (GNAT) family protein [Posidoniimonas polymericola]|uniref:Acetyltransferase (GNAT) family protein n=1 Tax=Posidoniimonas polymericola TaxID=2528002 RepID=A0A5C5YRF6_9BACT|nr:GNAT family N-acetyltransferase [Posidoniimonas polymericola]TWT77300.1 Acetyltransferase (GNAT) family protein [Posidoniimonas polymericola]
MTKPFRIERLAKQDRSGFDCGIPPLNDYLHKQAGQDERRRFAACYLLVDAATSEVAGYYTLAAGSVLLGDLPQATAKKLPRYPSVPVVRIGRLAVDQRYQGKKLGGVLLVDAIQRAASTDVGVYAVIVDAKDEAAATFYEHHGFTRFESAPRVLFLPVASGLANLP